MDLEDRIDNDEILMLGRIDVERLIEMYEMVLKWLEKKRKVNLY